MNHIILIGFMGAGKTTIGKRLAETAGMRFADTDQLIEEQAGRAISDIFAREGETYFRDLETRLLYRLQEEEEPAVIAVGGGLPVREKNRELLRKLGTVVYLKAEVETLVNRLSGDTSRPKLQGGDLREKIISLMDAREGFYKDAAGMEYQTDHRTAEEAAEELRKTLCYRWGQPQTPAASGSSIKN